MMVKDHPSRGSRRGRSLCDSLFEMKIDRCKNMMSPRDYLAAIGIDYEYCEPVTGVPSDASVEQILNVYAKQIDETQEVWRICDCRCDRC